MCVVSCAENIRAHLQSSCVGAVQINKSLKIYKILMCVSPLTCGWMVDTTPEKSRCIVYICDFSKYLEDIVSYFSKPQIWILLERSYKFYNMEAS